MGNQMEENMENDMEAGFFIGLTKKGFLNCRRLDEHQRDFEICLRCQTVVKQGTKTIIVAKLSRSL